MGFDRTSSHETTSLVLEGLRSADLGRYEEAMRFWELALVRDPDFRPAQICLQQVESYYKARSVGVDVAEPDLRASLRSIGFEVAKLFEEEVAPPDFPPEPQPRTTPELFTWVDDVEDPWGEHAEVDLLPGWNEESSLILAGVGEDPAETPRVPMPPAGQERAARSGRDAGDAPGGGRPSFEPSHRPAESLAPFDPSEASPDRSQPHRDTERRFRPSIGGEPSSSRPPRHHSGERDPLPGGHRRTPGRPDDVPPELGFDFRDDDDDIFELDIAGEPRRRPRSGRHTPHPAGDAEAGDPRDDPFAVLRGRDDRRGRPVGLDGETPQGLPAHGSAVFDHPGASPRPGQRTTPVSLPSILEEEGVSEADHAGSEPLDPTVFDQEPAESWPPRSGPRGPEWRGRRRRRSGESERHVQTTGPRRTPPDVDYPALGQDRPRVPPDRPGRLEQPTPLVPLPATHETGERSDLEAHLERAIHHRALGELSASQAHLEKVLAEDPGHRRARDLYEENVKLVEKRLVARLGSLDAVPRLRIESDELIWQNLDARKGFLLSRVDGESTIRDILDIVHFPRHETLELLAALVEDGIVICRKR